MLLSKYLIPMNIQSEYKDTTDLMTKLGLIHQNESGFYSYLPYGKAIFDNIVKILKNGLNDLCCQEISIPSLVSINDLFESGRFDHFEGELFETEDRTEKKYVLAATAEEQFTKLLKNYLYSYRQVPLILYQIDKKYRDEIRPREGIVRSKCFTMMDAYSFDISEKDADLTYEKMREFIRSFINKLDIGPLDIIKVDNGVMGGNYSEEFVVGKHGDNPGLEIAHIFKLETKYTKAFHISIKDNKNKDVYPYMGCYGIGIDRLFYRLIHINKDDTGYCLKENLQPFKLMIIPSENKYIDKCIKIADILEQKTGKKVLVDDRTGVSLGKKLKTCDSMGIGKRLMIYSGIEEGMVRFRRDKYSDEGFNTYEFILDDLTRNL